MKIACVYPPKPNWPKMLNVQKALKNLGHSVVHVDGPDALRKADKKVDICVFMHKSPGIRWPNLRPVAKNRQSVWVQWYFDLLHMETHKPLIGQEYFKKFLPIMQEMDAVFVKERALIDEYKSHGINAIYLDQGCPSDIGEAKPPRKPEWDVLLWGQCGHEYMVRVRDAGALAKAGLKVAWASNENAFSEMIEHVAWTHPDDLPLLASRAMCVLSIDRVINVDGYWSDRFMMACGMGACVLSRRPKDKLDEPYFYYRNRDELVLSVHELKRTGNWVRFGREARQWVLDNHTIEHRCRDLLKHTARLVRIRESSTRKAATN